VSEICCVADRGMYSLIFCFVSRRKNPFTLIVAFDSHQVASGSLYWDDGDSIGVW